MLNLLLFLLCIFKHEFKLLQPKLGTMFTKCCENLKDKGRGVTLPHPPGHQVQAEFLSH